MTPVREASFSTSLTRKARSWAGRVGGRLGVVAGPGPLRATEPGRKAKLGRGETMAAKGKKAGTEKAATSGKPKLKPKPKKKISRGK
jgi:hypothetical protein